jgi:hypothetical protein
VQGLRTPAASTERARHGVDVLLHVYAKFIAEQQDDAKRRIAQATQARQPNGGIPRQL